MRPAPAAGGGRSLPGGPGGLLSRSPAARFGFALQQLDIGGDRRGVTKVARPSFTIRSRPRRIWAYTAWRLIRSIAMTSGILYITGLSDGRATSTAAAAPHPPLLLQLRPCASESPDRRCSGPQRAASR